MFLRAARVFSPTRSPRLYHRFTDHLCDLLGILMRSETERRRFGLGERRVGVGVAPPVALDLCDPVVGVEVGGF
jgi:hypothetical protein